MTQYDYSGHVLPGEFQDALWTAADGAKEQAQKNHLMTQQIAQNNYLPPNAAGIIAKARQQAPYQNAGASYAPTVTASTPSQPVPAPVQVVSPPASVPSGALIGNNPLNGPNSTWDYFMNGGAG